MVDYLEVWKSTIPQGPVARGIDLAAYLAMHLAIGDPTARCPLLVREGCRWLLYRLYMHLMVCLSAEDLQSHESSRTKDFIFTIISQWALSVLICILYSITKRCKTLSGHNVVEGKDFKNTA